MIYHVKVITRSSREEVITQDENHIKVKLTQVAQKGKANIALIKLLSKTFDTNANNIKILRGEFSPNKIIQITKNN